MRTLLMHAAGLDSRMWDAIGLDETLNVERIDLRGHGAAPQLHKGAQLSDLANDVVKLLEEESTEEVVLVGSSLGGMIAQLIVVNRPNLVKGLVLTNTLSAATEQMATAMRARARTLRAEGIGGVANETIHRWFSKSTRISQPELVNRVRGWLLEADVETHARIWEAISVFDITSSIHTIQVPTLVMSGLDDQSTPPNISRWIANEIRGAELHEMAGAGHMMPLERAEEFSRVVTKFVRKL